MGGRGVLQPSGLCKGEFSLTRSTILSLIGFVSYVTHSPSFTLCLTRSQVSHCTPKTPLLYHQTWLQQSTLPPVQVGSVFESLTITVQSLTLCLFPLANRMLVEVLYEDKGLQTWEYFYLLRIGDIHLILLVRQPLSDTHYSLMFTHQFLAGSSPFPGRAP